MELTPYQINEYYDLSNSRAWVGGGYKDSWFIYDIWLDEFGDYICTWTSARSGYGIDPGVFVIKARLKTRERAIKWHRLKMKSNPTWLERLQIWWIEKGY